MRYTPYATTDDYVQYGSGDIPTAQLGKALYQASRQIDSLTYNRIVGKGFLQLTGFQQDVIRDVCCRQADFYYDNQEAIESALLNYSINGVSMAFGTGQNVKYINGVFIHSGTYSLLAQSGLTCRMVVI